MTAHSPIAASSSLRPERRIPRFARIGRQQLAGIPGRKGLPLLGILPEAAYDPLSFVQKMYDRFGPVHCFYACGNWNVQLVGPEANELVLADREGNFSAYGGWKPVFGRHFDGGLLLRDGADHHWHRKILASAFKRDHLQSYVTVFSRNAARVRERWSGETVEAYALCQQLTFRNGYKAFLGRPSDRATRDDLRAFRSMMKSAAAVMPFPFPGNAHAKAEWAKKHIRGLLRPLLSVEPEPERTDLAAVLVRMRNEGLLTDEEVVAHLTFVVAASFDTLSSGTLSTLYHLATDADWQERVRAELCATIPSADDLTIDQLQQCQESEWALKEALRLKAAAPVLWRRAARDVEFEGYKLPAGTLVGVNPMLTHFLPSVWEEPHRFNPERFAPAAASQRHRYAFVPFGAGAHACLGANYASLQARVLLRHILEHHEVKLAQADEPRWHHWPNCRPVGGLKLELRRL